MEVVFANGSWREKGRRRRVESNEVPIVPLTWNRERGRTIREIIIIIIEGIAGREEGEEQEAMNYIGRGRGGRVTRGTNFRLSIPPAVIYSTRFRSNRG